ncbi:Golgi apparatus membrane protein TVP38 [Ceratobasidium sp. AG-Ba]|nr:Golgi apparatus membrane protein TVP38 [Ceratobasidium sp. AG-Ba]
MVSAASHAPQPVRPSSRSSSSSSVADPKNVSAEANDRRSASPTPSERVELREFEGTLRKFFRLESWKNPRFLLTIFGIVILIAIVVLISIFQDEALKLFLPTAKWVRRQTVGYLIPIALLIILSIPPLLGGEIVMLLLGFTYGLWVGFLITCIGMTIGECITYYMFYSCLRPRAEKLEKVDGRTPRFAALARVIREGGFWVALLVKYSAFPSHITSALFATCGVSFSMFFLVLVLSLPRQLANVYFGVLSAEAARGRNSDEDTILSYTALGVTILLTIIAMILIQRRLTSAALAIIRERRARERVNTSYEPKPFDPAALYDPEAAHSARIYTDPFSDAHASNPALPITLGGVVTSGRPAEIHVESSVA